MNGEAWLPVDLLGVQSAPNNSMQLTALRAAADAERNLYQSL